MREVSGFVIGGGEVKFKVSGVDDATGGGIKKEADTVGDGVVDVKKFGVEGLSEVDFVVGGDGVDFYFRV